MNNAIAQIAAIARIESRMLWRGRMLRVLLVSIAVLIIVQAAIGLDGFRQFYPRLINADQVTDYTALVLFFTWIPHTVSLTMMLPFLVCDTIPKDPRLGVRELLESSPLSPGVYLLGKLLGVWLALFVGLASLMIVAALFWRVVAGPYNLLRYGELWLVGITSLALLNSGIGVLIPAGLSHVRSAAGALVAVFGLTLLVGVSSRAILDGTVSLIRGPIINYFMRINELDLNGLVSLQDVLLTILIGALQLAGLFFAWRWWFSYRAASR